MKILKKLLIILATTGYLASMQAGEFLPTQRLTHRDETLVHSILERGKFSESLAQNQILSVSFKQMPALHHDYTGRFTEHAFPEKFAVAFPRQNIILFSPKVYNAIKKAVEADKPLAVHYTRIILHEAGHLVQTEANKQLQDALKRKWVMRQPSDEEDIYEMAADVYSINHLTAPELDGYYSQDLQRAPLGNPTNIHSPYLTKGEMKYMIRERLANLLWVKPVQQAAKDKVIIRNMPTIKHALSETLLPTLQN